LPAARPGPDAGVNNRGGGASRRSPYTVRMPIKSNDRGLSRRSVFATLAGAGLVASIRVAQATPASMKAAINKVVGEAPVNKGRVHIDVPVLVDNGNTVPLIVDVDSPMTAVDHVKAIHIFNE